MNRRRLARLLILVAALGLGLFGLIDLSRRAPQDLPWTALDLRQPVGMFTGRKLAGLGRDPARCRGLLAQAGVAFTLLPPRHDTAECGYDDALLLGGRPSGTGPIDAGLSCPMAAGMIVWEREVVQTAAQRHFGRRVARIEHLGSYNCRRMYGRATGRWSEHARANAFDIVAFRLDDGRRIAVAADWPDPGARGLFLREVRDGACRLFATVLSPDYNPQHHDHLHLDQAGRGEWGGRACR
jgi:hypothetical protein